MGVWLVAERNVCFVCLWFCFPFKFFNKVRSDVAQKHISGSCPVFINGGALLVQMHAFKKLGNLSVSTPAFHSLIKTTSFHSQGWFKGILDAIASPQTQTTGFAGPLTSRSHLCLSKDSPSSWILRSSKWPHNYRQDEKRKGPKVVEQNRWLYNASSWRVFFDLMR